MKNYSKMSDFEINKLVAVSQGFAPENCDIAKRGSSLVGVDWDEDTGSAIKVFDYCNNPSDAWPIIVENKISVMFDRSVEYGDSSEWCLASSPCDRYIVDYVSSNKLLRAAMIVYLMMKDGENA